MIKFIQNMRFIFKLAISPVLVLIFLLVLFALSNNAMNIQEKALREVVEVEYQTAMEVKKISAEFQDLDRRVYQTLTFTAAEKQDDPTSALQSLVPEIEAINKRIAKLVAQLKARGKTEMAAVLTAQTAALTTYGEAISVVADFIELDFSASAEQVAPFVENANDIIGSFLKIVAEQEAAARQQYANAVEEVSSVRNQMNLIGLAAVILSMVVTYLLGKFIAQSIRGIAVSTRELAEGNVEQDLTALARNDELGAIVRALGVFKESFVENERMRAEAKQREEDKIEADRQAFENEQRRQREEAEEKRKQEAESERKRRELLNTVAAEFDETVNAVIAALKTQSDKVLSTSEELKTYSEDNIILANNFGESSQRLGTNMHSVAAATEEMSSSVGEITRQVTEAADVSKQAVTEVNHSTTSVEELNTRAQKIGEVVSIITDIAEQTNLLALNATIEAARAGDAGKGFAVVASEVKNLAAQTSKATEEIADQIKNIQDSTGFTVESINRISATIQKVEETSSIITATVEEQGEATREINQTVVRSNDDVQELSSDSSKLNTFAQQNSQIASVLSAASSDLKSVVSTLEDSAKKFVAAINE